MIPTEFTIEDATRAWFELLGCEVLQSSNISGSMLSAERSVSKRRDMVMVRKRPGHQRLKNVQFNYGGKV